MNSLKHICIFTQSPLSRAPRVVKEANVYARAGYKVTIYGLWYDKIILETDRLLLEPSIVYKAGVDLLDWNSFSSKKIRFQRMLSRNLVKYFGVQSTSALGYYFGAYLKKLHSENADIYIGHEEMSMALAKELLKNGKKVVFDFEDWHSKDLLPKDRVYRPIRLLEKLEKWILENASYCYTTSEAMAQAMANYHNTDKPEVIYNSFLASDRNQMDHLHIDLKHHALPSVFWFSQVISKGRGLELLFDALPMVKTSFQLHLRGQISDTYRQEISLRMPSHIELYIHNILPPEALISRIAEHDLGLAFEETQPESRNYTITNKIFHYLQSGIAILATETAGQLEVAKKAPVTMTIVAPSSKDIAESLDKILTDLTELKQRKKASWEAGYEIFAFENQADHLLRLINNELII